MLCRSGGMSDLSGHEVTSAVVVLVLVGRLKWQVPYPLLLLSCALSFQTKVSFSSRDIFRTKTKTSALCRGGANCLIVLV